MKTQQKITVVVDGKTKKECDNAIDLIKKTLAGKKIKARFEHIYVT